MNTPERKSKSDSGFVVLVSGDQELGLVPRLKEALAFLNEQGAELKAVRKVGVDNMLLDFGVQVADKIQQAVFAAGTDNGFGSAGDGLDLLGCSNSSRLRQFGGLDSTDCPAPEAWIDRPFRMANSDVRVWELGRPGVVESWHDGVVLVAVGSCVRRCSGDPLCPYPRHGYVCTSGFYLRPHVEFSPCSYRRLYQPSIAGAHNRCWDGSRTRRSRLG